jgi:prophage regulatory protein
MLKNAAPNLWSPSDVCGYFGIAESTLYDWLNEKSPRHKADFPEPIYLSSRCVRYRDSDIHAWVNQKLEGGAGDE